MGQTVQTLWHNCRETNAVNYFKRHLGSFVAGLIAPLPGLFLAGPVLRIMPGGDPKSDMITCLVIMALGALIAIACLKAGSAIDAMRERKSG
jgi:hypothetical protein